MLDYIVRNEKGIREVRTIPESKDVPVSPIFCVVTAEDNGTLATDKMDFSFGNGKEHTGLSARGWGLIIPKDGLEITHLTFGSRNITEKTKAVVELIKNPNPNKSTNYESTKFYVECPSGEYFGFSEGSVIFNKGEALNFITRVRGREDVVVSAWGRWV